MRRCLTTATYVLLSVGVRVVAALDNLHLAAHPHPDDPEE